MKLASAPSYFSSSKSINSYKTVDNGQITMSETQYETFDELLDDEIT